MYLRLSNVRQGSRTYRYAQLVESFRGPNGTPTNRVVAHLGALDDLAIANFRVVISANRAGKAMVLASEIAGSVRARASVHESLRYLDLAVLHSLWQQMSFDVLLQRALSDGEATVPCVQVIAALVFQRCVAPGTKLAAERWYPTTALPELQSIRPAQFNNSRIHRALDALDEGGLAIQASLPALLSGKEGAFTTLFIDATDTWFVGDGPPCGGEGS